jgi:hypothetical protein
MKLYPKAKVVLTVRDTPEDWVKSVRETIFSTHPAIATLPRILQFYANANAVSNRRFLRQVLWFSSSGYIPDPRDTDALVKYYNDHIAYIKKIVPADKLLVFNVKQGYGPLCEFLGVPTPKEPFPKVNDSEAFKARVIGRLDAGGNELFRKISLGVLLSAAGLWALSKL